MHPNSFKYLFEQYINGRIDPEGLKQLKRYIEDETLSVEFNDLLTNAYGDSRLELTSLAEEETWNSIKERIETNLRPVHRVHLLRTAWFRTAAVILVLIASIAFYYAINTSKKSISPPHEFTTKTDIQPASNKAILTLSDGKKIELDNTTSEIISDGSTSIRNIDGQLLYKSGDTREPALPGERREAGTAAGGLVAGGYNTMSTSNGGQYQLTLSDGTRAWLNAASSISYPTKFSGTTREVKITGEVYFEVAQQKNQPFIVKTNKDQITVLGTSFNVNNYPDEPLSKTSLISGSIKINPAFALLPPKHSEGGKTSAEDVTIFLKPGQAFTNGKIISTDISQDIAWKNGIFNFQDKKFDEVMRQIARWYNIEIIYSNGIPNKEYGGKLKRNLTLSQILKILENSGISFRLDGRKLIVKP